MRLAFLAATALLSGLIALALLYFAALGLLVGGADNLLREKNWVTVIADAALAAVCLWLFHIAARQFFVERGKSPEHRKTL